jgi:hypothetical protein
MKQVEKEIIHKLKQLICELEIINGKLNNNDYLQGYCNSSLLIVREMIRVLNK